jgi:hypothetical protein
MSEEAFDMNPICPRCGVSTVTPSKAHGLTEKLGRVVCLGSYRCHTCLKRFRWFMSPFLRFPDRSEARAERASAGG